MNGFIVIPVQFPENDSKNPAACLALIMTQINLTPVKLNH